jgi:DNA-binding CsgD family transcriptional regulator
VLTPCRGRDAERDELAAALASARCVSLVGPPGCGKTLLARHVAAAYPSLAWVDAELLTDPDDIIDACLTALAAERAPGDSARGALARAIDGRDALLVVDGVGEDAALAQILGEVMADTTGARCLVTASAPFGVPHERVVRLGPLALPGPGRPLVGPAVDLCLDRVAAAGGPLPDLDRDGSALRRLLQATGGLPLLIEQLAVQVALVGVANAVPSASLAEAVQATYSLLDPEQRRCFRRLSQMTVPVGLDILAEISELDRSQAAAVAEALARRSLVNVEGDGRIGMLAPIRSYGLALAAGTDDAQLALDGLLRWADAVAPDDPLVGAADEVWLDDLPLMRAAISAACARPETRDLGYSLANRAFPALYTAMRYREASEILEGVLTSGDGPADIGAQVARRAGIAASEARGTYEGLWLLDRAEEHAASAPNPALESARNLSIRAEMHLDAGDLARAEVDALRTIELGREDGYVVRQASRTLVDVYVSRGDFRQAQAMAGLVMTGAPPEERWLALAARVLLGRIALEQGRLLEAGAAARAAYSEARDTGEDRIAMLAETLARQVDPSTEASLVDREALPWAVRLGVLCQDARTLLLAGEAERAAGLAADVVVLADSCRLGRDGVEARLLLGHALADEGEDDQAAMTFLAALDRAVGFGLATRAADALDGLASMGQRRGGPWVTWARGCAAAALAVRAERYAVPGGLTARGWVDPMGRPVPEGWVVDGMVTAAAAASVAATWSAGDEPVRSLVDLLTKAEREVARKVAAGLTTRQIAEALFVSPRTVDAHLSHIYRKLGITSRARLAALMTEPRSRPM